MPALAAAVADGPGVEGDGKEAVGDRGELVAGKGEVSEGGVGVERLGQRRGAEIRDAVEAQVEEVEAGQDKTAQTRVGNQEGHTRQQTESQSAH